MLSDKKKSLVKLYAILALAFCALIVISYILDVFLIRAENIIIKPDYLWFEYVKSTLFGIFTGLLTGLAISFYEYKQQIYSELYSYIKLNRDSMSSIENVLISKEYSLSLLRIAQYQNEEKSFFVIRKLRKNNEQIVKLINEIKRDVSNIYSELSKLNNEYQNCIRHRQQIESQNEELISLCCTKVQKTEIVDNIKALQKQRQAIKNTLIILEESLESHSNKSIQILKEIEKKNLTLYEYVNNCRQIFVL